MAKARWDQLTEEFGQPKQDDGPTDTTNAADLEEWGHLSAEKGATHARIIIAEAGLSQ